MNTTTSDTPLLTVTQLTQAIKMKLESTFPSICLQGEVSNFKLQSSGHLYFSLKDAHAQISAVMFKGNAAKIKNLPKDGSHVTVFGELNVYPPTGKYQLVIRELKLMGLGELLLKLEELKIKLHQKGYFRSDRKKKLPKFPKRIGVVTSPTGAVIQDILNVLSRRFSGFQLLLNPVKVQGEGAAEEIAKAIEFFNAHDLVDVMIVGRGGGSVEDLFAFNEEIVANAIYNSRIPIISAVGHETDHCIADYVADYRAPTPSAAAEVVIAEKALQLLHLKQIAARSEQILEHRLNQARLKLTRVLKAPFFCDSYAFLGRWMQQVDDYRSAADRSIQQNLSFAKLRLNAYARQAEALAPHSRIFHYKEKLLRYLKTLDQAWYTKLQGRRNLFLKENAQKLIDQSFERIIFQRKERLCHLIEALKSIDPKKLLAKGYAILFSENDRSVITSVRSVACDQSVKVLLFDGELTTQVKDVLPK